MYRLCRIASFSGKQDKGSNRWRVIDRRDVAKTGHTWGKVMNHTFRSCIAGAIALTLAAACTTSSPKLIPLDERLADRGYIIGEPVESIREFSIDSWSAVDRSHFMLHAGPSRKYLVTVDKACRNLRAVDHLGFSTTIGVLTDKDTVVVDSAAGGIKHCAIDAIHSLDNIDEPDSGQ